MPHARCNPGGLRYIQTRSRWVTLVGGPPSSSATVTGPPLRLQSLANMMESTCDASIISPHAHAPSRPGVSHWLRAHTEFDAQDFYPNL